MQTQRPEEEGAIFSLFSEFCFFKEEETFTKKQPSWQPSTPHRTLTNIVSHVCAYAGHLLGAQGHQD